MDLVFVFVDSDFGRWVNGVGVIDCSNWYLYQSDISIAFSMVLGVQLVEIIKFFTMVIVSNAMHCNHKWNACKFNLIVKTICYYSWHRK